MTHESIVKAVRIPEPSLQFYLGTHLSPRAVMTLKPFSYKDFLDRRAKIKLLADRDTYDLAAKLVNHLIGGYSYLGEGYPGFYHVFGVKLEFNKDSDSKIVTLDDLPVNIEEALDQLKSELGSHVGGSAGAVIVAVKDLPDNIYKLSKKKVMLSYGRLNLRLQFVRKQTLEGYTGTKSYAYLLMNIATALYAKMGGIPWKLARSVFPTKGLILGISFSRRRLKKSDKEVIYYGAIQVFDRFGEHLDTQIKMFVAPKDLVTKGLYVPRDEMVKILENAIRRYGVGGDDRIPVTMIAIHKSAPITSEELYAVKEVVDRYSGQHPLFYIFAHVKGNTIYRAYDPSAQDYSVQRGLMLLRSGTSGKLAQYIIFTTGRFYKGVTERGKLGTPKPLELAIDTNIPNLAPSYIGVQVLALTKLDWNTTDPEVREPITIKYSRRAAEMAPLLLESDRRDMVIADLRDLM